MLRDRYIAPTHAHVDTSCQSSHFSGMPQAPPADAHTNSHMDGKVQIDSSTHGKSMEARHICYVGKISADRLHEQLHGMGWDGMESAGLDGSVWEVTCLQTDKLQPAFLPCREDRGPDPRTAWSGQQHEGNLRSSSSSESLPLDPKY